MAINEDAASVLEQFVQDVANLPAEIAHLLEEVQAKEVLIQECQRTISKCDINIQKHYKAHGPQTPHPKEDVYCKQVSEAYDKAQALQDEKIVLSEKAAALLDRHVKRLDVKIRDLHNEGSVSYDPPLPSLLNPNSRGLASATTTGTSTPLNSLHPNAAPPSTTIANNPALRLPHSLVQANRPAAHSPLANPLVPANLITALPTPPSSGPSASANGGPNSHSSLADPSKKRKLNPAGTAQSGALTPSALKQSTLTALTGATSKPASGTVSRGSSAGPRSAKKAPAGPKKLAPHQAAAAARKSAKAGSSQPKSLHKKTLKRQHGGGSGRTTKRSGSAGTHSISATSGSDGSGSESEADSVAGRGAGSGSQAEGGTSTKREDEDMEDVGEADGDDRKYCVCQTVSHGDMVACDNEDCEFEWFHWECVGLKSEPAGKWYCESCKAKLGIAD